MALFPAALGVPRRVQGVRRDPGRRRAPRAAAAGSSLVKANSRISLAGVAGAAISAPLAVAASTFGPQWSLRYAFLVFVGATILAILLPARVDSRRRGEPPVARWAARPQRPGVPRGVVVALRCNAGLRLLSAAS